MKLSVLPHLSHALAYLAVDIGAVLQTEAEVPEGWADRATAAEAELTPMTAAQVEEAVGDEFEQGRFKLAAPEADRLLHDAFDGNLSDVFFANMTSGLDYLGVEETAAKLRLNKE